MTLIITIVLIFIVLKIWLSRSTSEDNSVHKKYNNQIDEDRNYSSLKKMFWHVSYMRFTENHNKVYGVLIEAHLKENKKILFATLKTGYAGYYQSKGGGIIGGKRYPENDRNVQQELMQLYDDNNLISESQTIKIRKMAAKFTKKANEFLNRAVLAHNWPDSQNTTKFWFLTKEGIYFAEVENSEINNSIWKELVTEGYNIIKELNRDLGHLGNPFDNPTVHEDKLPF